MKIFKWNRRVVKWKNFSLKLNIFSKRKIFSKFFFKSLFIFFLFLFLWFLIFFLFFSNYFSISNISFERKNFSFNPENISKDLEKYFWKNIFFVNTFSIEKKLEEKHSQFKKIIVKKIYPDTLFFEVENFEDIFEIQTYFTKKNKDTWIYEKFVQNFLISQAGELKYLPEKSEKKLKKIFIKEDLWKKLEIWEKFLKPKNLAKIQKINNFLEKNEKLKIEKIFYWPNWIEVHFLSNKWEFWFTLSKNIDNQLEKIWDFKNFKNISDFTKKEFEYLDLRIKDKIIFK